MEENLKQLKANKDKGKIMEAKYRIITFVIFRLVLFPLETTKIISIKTIVALIEYKYVYNISFLLYWLNHYCL